MEINIENNLVVFMQIYTCTFMPMDGWLDGHVHGARRVDGHVNGLRWVDGHVNRLRRVDGHVNGLRRVDGHVNRLRWVDGHEWAETGRRTCCCWGSKNECSLHDAK